MKVSHTLSALLVCAASVALPCSVARAAQPDSDLYRQAVKLYDSWQYQESLEKLLEADKQFPRNGYIYYYISQIMSLANRYDESYRYAKQALDYFKPDDNIGKADTYLHLAFLANLYEEVEGLTEADVARFYDAAVNAAPRYAKAYTERGKYYDIYKEDFTRSDADYIKAIELDPKEVEPYSFLIWSYRDRGLTDNAEEYCRKCIKDVTEYPHHYDILCQILLKRGETQQARDLLWEAFLSCDDYYFQGMETVMLFPDEERKWFIDRITEQMQLHPEQQQWKKYLEY